MEVPVRSVPVGRIWRSRCRCKCWGKKCFLGLILIKCFWSPTLSLEDQWDESFPEKWLLIPCRYDTLNSGVVCESCPIGYEVNGIWVY